MTIQYIESKDKEGVVYAVRCDTCTEIIDPATKKARHGLIIADADQNLTRSKATALAKKHEREKGKGHRLEVIGWGVSETGELKGVIEAMRSIWRVRTGGN